MPKFRKKPVIVEAIQWDGKNADEIAQWMQGGWHGPTAFAKTDKGMWIKQKVIDPDADPIECVWFLVIPTLEGDHEARPGDWIIKGIANEFYPCKPEIFAKSYESVN